MCRGDYYQLINIKQEIWLSSFQADGEGPGGGLTAVLQGIFPFCSLMAWLRRVADRWIEGRPHARRGGRHQEQGRPYRQSVTGK